MKQLPPARNMKIKNHILPKGKALNSQLSAKFGITVADFEKACMGDLNSIQKIGELNKQATFMSEYAPKLKDAYIQIIEGTETYNLALADILKASGAASLRITKAMDQTALANRKYVNGRVEQARQFLTDKQAENARHAYQMNYQEVKGYMDAFLVNVDRQTAILEQSNRPEIKQREADQQYQGKMINEYLDNGNNARIDLIPQKDYRTGIAGKIAGIKSALGF